MSDAFTPDEEQVREQYTQEQPPQIGTVTEKRAEFDRFIARVKAEAAVKAVREAASALCAMADDSPFVTVTGGLLRDDNGNDCGDFDREYAAWLSERADRIEKEER